ncbi:MAG: hypothetical protein JNL94_07825 [Planctomycetes bacterium]|nr:hypothetical protein [Planctomycetota bacterium]
MTDGKKFDEDDAVLLRAKFVVDRVDGRPLLLGHADCPVCAVRLKLKPVGNMELRDAEIKIRFFVECGQCSRELSIEDSFHWGP